MKPLTYKDFSAQIEYSAEDECFVGHIAGISDIIGFHGESAEEIRTAFQEAVDDYLECCAHLCKIPQKQSGEKVLVHLPEDIHLRASELAKKEGVSLHEFLSDKICKAVKS